MARTFTARYDGRCADCGGRFYAGDRIETIDRGEYAHADREICQSYQTQAAEQAMEQGFEARITGAWVNMPEYGGQASYDDDYDDDGREI